MEVEKIASMILYIALGSEDDAVSYNWGLLF